MFPSLLRMRPLLTYLVILSLVLSTVPPDVSAQTTGTMIRFEDSATGVTTTGTWSSVTTSDASSGTVRQSSSTNSTLSLTFTGPWLALGLRGATSLGIVEVLIDGMSQGLVDTYLRQTGTVTRIYSGLANTTHTVTLRVTGTRNPLASANTIQLDYFEVWDGLLLAQGTFEQDSSRVRRGTNWTTQNQSAASGGSYLRDGSNAWFGFTGTSVSFDAIAESGAGTIQIFLDGVSQGFFDLNTSEPYTADV